MARHADGAAAIAMMPALLLPPCHLFRCRAAAHRPACYMRAYFCHAHAEEC